LRGRAKVTRKQAASGGATSPHDDSRALRMALALVMVLTVVRVAALRLVPADDLAHVFDDARAARNVDQREHALAVHARAAHLEAAWRRGLARGFAGHGGKFAMLNGVGARVHVRACASGCAWAHARESRKF